MTTIYRYLTDQLARLVDWMTEGRWQVVPTQVVDSLHFEIFELEQSLSEAPTRPMRLRKPDNLDVPEYQKVVDLAG